MHIRALAASVFVFALPAFAMAQTWTSPDGFLSLTPPNADTFQAVTSPPPPFIGLWVSNDESMRFGVVKIAVPRNIKLIQSSAEEGFAEAIGGNVARLPTREVSGHEVWTMKASGPLGETTQALVRHDGALYKVMAATVGGAPDAALVDQFINSLSVAQPSTPLDTQPVRDLGGGVDPHDLSTRIGGAAALLGIGLLIYFALRGKRSRQS